MKIIDLINKISKGEIPQKIIFDNEEFHWDEDKRNYFNKTCLYSLNWEYIVFNRINDPVEIIQKWCSI